MSKVKALTIWQPWASLIIYGGKDIENRDWEPPKSLIGKRIAIHASTRDDKAALEKYKGRYPEPLPHGVILGTVRLDGYWGPDSPISKNEWRLPHYAYGWQFSDAKPLAVQPKCPGWLKLWDVPEPIEHLCIDEKPTTCPTCGTGYVSRPGGVKCLECGRSVDWVAQT